MDKKYCNFLFIHLLVEIIHYGTYTITIPKVKDELRDGFPHIQYINFFKCVCVCVYLFSLDCCVSK